MKMLLNAHEMELVMKNGIRKALELLVSDSVTLDITPMNIVINNNSLDDADMYVEVNKNKNQPDKGKE